MRPFLGWMFTPEGSAERPLLSATAAGVLVFPAMSAVAYFRFADRNLALALTAGALCAVAIFLVVYQKARALRAEQQLAKPRSRFHVRRYTAFDVVLVLLGVGLVVTSAIYATWALVVPGLIFAGLGGILILLRRFAARRRNSKQ